MFFWYKEKNEETQIEEGQKITIDKDGIYKVIAYTYGEEGNRSRITYEIIKVNKTGIEATINYSTTESTTDPVIATVTFNKEGIWMTYIEYLHMLWEKYLVCNKHKEWFSFILSYFFCNKNVIIM